MKAWWFSSGKSLPHGDDRRMKIGHTHRVKGEIVPCRNGLHGSVKILDALQYAPGPIVWRVELGGVIVPHSNDKHASSERKYVAGGIDATDVLRKFACSCALDVIDLWTAPEIVVRYLKTGDESIRDAASAAAWDAASAAASAAAWAAAWDAASAAASAAAWAAAWDAAWDKQNRRLTRMVNAAIRKAAE